MRKVRIIGVPLDLGQERRGVDMGPSALRVADLNARISALGFEVEDAGNVAVPIREMQHPGNHRSRQFVFLRPLHRSVPLRPSPLPQQPAGMPLR